MSLSFLRFLVLMLRQPWVGIQTTIADADFFGQGCHGC